MEGLVAGKPRCRLRNGETKIRIPSRYITRARLGSLGGEIVASY